jgi:flavin-dependent dehydrogenase
MAPGIVLLGDAASSLDPITEGGMAQALLTAELLARYVTGHWRAGDGWLRDYDRARRALLRDEQLLTPFVLGRPSLARTAGVAAAERHTGALLVSNRCRHRHSLPRAAAAAPPPRRAS